MDHKTRIGATAIALTVFVAIAACGPAKRDGVPSSSKDGLVLLGDKTYPVKIFHLSADGRAAVGLAFEPTTDPKKATPPAGDLVFDEPPTIRHSFRWTEGGGVQFIKTHDGRDVDVEAISADGEVVVGQFIDAAGLAHVFRWTESGGVEDLGAPDGHPDVGMCGRTCAATATTVSTDGSVIFGRLANFSSFRWTRAAGIRDLHIQGDVRAASADGSTAIGSVFIDSGDDRMVAHLFRWTLSRGFEDLGMPAGTVTTGKDSLSAEAISADGSTMVGEYPTTEGMRGFRWNKESGFQDLQGGGDAEIRAVSRDGSQVFGALWLSPNGPHAVRWLKDGSSQPVGPPNLPVLVVVSVSADGLVIAGPAVAGKGDIRGLVLRIRPGS